MKTSERREGGAGVLSWCMWCAVWIKPPEKQTEEQREEALLTRSDLWRTLFRGGYMPGKLTRSLSGAHVRGDLFSTHNMTLSVSQMASPATELNSQLQDMANGENGRAKQLLDR